MAWTGDSLTDRVMRLWTPRRPGLLHDYAHAGFLLSPNPSIMEAAKDNKTQDHVQAIARLITKLILDPLLVGTAKTETLATLIETFWDEHSDFTLQSGGYDEPHIWITAAKPETPAWRWHKNYSLHTKVLGKLAMLVCSKGLGIGTAERQWKQMKAVKSGQRSRTAIEKCKKQAQIFGRYQQQRGDARRVKLSSAGKLWEDEDFRTCKMDPFCAELIESVEGSAPSENPTRIFRAWRETWEQVAIPPNGDSVLEARLLHKYGGLKWIDPDYSDRLTVHPDKMYFEKKRGNNAYLILAIKDGFDASKPLADQSDKYDPWGTELLDAFYECVIDFYKDKNSIKCYSKGDDCDSEEE